MHNYAALMDRITYPLLVPPFVPPLFAKYAKIDGTKGIDEF